MSRKQEEVIITIDKDGNPKIEVEGGDGKTCVDLTKELESQLGTVDERKFKPEYRQNNGKVANRIQSRR
ncbi:UNVERIFIED_CONTAM: hypothetical protein BEN50_21605 [Euhalothece sp. KZN 001]